jgi:hypothetical protein
MLSRLHSTENRTRVEYACSDFEYHRQGIQSLYFGFLNCHWTRCSFIVNIEIGTVHVLKQYPSDRLPGYGEIRSLVDKGVHPRKYFCLSSLVCDAFAQLRAVSYTEALWVVVRNVSWRTNSVQLEYFCKLLGEKVADLKKTCLQCRVKQHWNSGEIS